MTHDNEEPSAASAGSTLLVTSILLEWDATDAVGWLKELVRSHPGPWLVDFSGYDADPREVWQIERCIDICGAIQAAGLLRYLTRDCAWLFFRVANRLFVRGTTLSMATDDQVSQFASLMS